MKHFPVMKDDVLNALAPKDGEIFIDGTFGAGGYTRAILECANTTVFAIDRDPTVAETAKEMGAAFPNRFRLIEGCFSDMNDLVPERVDGVALDIGVSSMQIDEAERGFSFMQDGPLSMKMGGDGPTAADVVNEMDEEELANIIYRYGEERASRRIARAIVAARPLSRTGELASVIEKVMGAPRYKKGKRQIHPATRTFQALRIYVNDELGELRRGLVAAEKMLKTGGRLCVVTFHSLEDRIVKKFFQERSGEASKGSRHLPQATDVAAAPTFEMIFRGAKKATTSESSENIRSRSAKLRAAVRTDAPPWAEEKAA